MIAGQTRHEGKTAQQWAEECQTYQRNLADAQADIAGEVEHSKELSTRVTELEALASRLKEHTRHEGKTAREWFAFYAASSAYLWQKRAEAAETRVKELESLASQPKESRPAPDKPSLWLCLNPYPEGEKPTVYHATLAAAKAEAERLASKTGRKIHVVRIVGTACLLKAARWEER
jgi:hypothetical protein